jgi:beta-lactam-binding protein with PASTA domain
VRGAVTLVSTAAAADPNGPRVMPDLSGQTLRSALAVLAPLGLEVEIHGQGRVVQQTPRAGGPLEPGAAARLTLTREGKR